MAPFTLRWGIISTGGIATKFAADLLVDPSTRDATDVAHKIAAVGSRSVPSAQKFIDKLKTGYAGQPAEWGSKAGLLDDTKAYGTYEEVYNDPNVDAVYIGTPHTYHHRNAKDALLAGKNVLCEKPFTLSLEELDELIAIAKEKNVFLMEAVWTRFHPIAYEVQKVIHGGKLGKIKRFAADFSLDFKPDEMDDSSRMVDPALGGGALLDMGPYPSVWAMLVVHQHPDNKDRSPKVINTHQTVYKRSNVDANSRWLVEWEDFAQAQLMTDMTAMGANDFSVVVTCEEGTLFVANPPWKPLSYSIHPHPSVYTQGSVKESSVVQCPHHPGGGMQYEADEVARCIRDGKKESARMPLDESRITQGWLDAVRTSGPTALANVKGTAGQ